jgi:hypothetical protein
MSTYRYAAYGSNLHPIRLRKRVPSAKLLGATHLDGYEIRFNKVGWRDGSGKCNITPNENRIYLAIFEILEAERAILDRFEGLGSGYDSAELRIDGFGACSTYVAAQGAIDEFRLPMDWYKEMVLLGCVANEFPQIYVQTIEAVSTRQDSNEKRAREQWKVVKELRSAT